MTGDLAVEPQQLAVVILEATVVALWALVALGLLRRGVNGPCELCLGMLAAWRCAVLLTLNWQQPGWAYLWGALFAQCFLYAVHHLAATVHCYRELVAKQASAAQTSTGAGLGSTTTSDGTAAGTCHQFQALAMRRCQRN